MHVKYFLSVLIFKFLFLIYFIPHRTLIILSSQICLFFFPFWILGFMSYLGNPSPFHDDFEKSSALVLLVPLYIHAYIKLLFLTTASEV